MPRVLTMVWQHRQGEWSKCALDSTASVLDMYNAKVVIVGPSGVGKTSIRSMYTSGRFSSGYRATIGTDFVTRTLPHYADPSESVTLQISDTAGQERFSSLATAFFRGADAVILVFDVTKRDTLEGLRKWWEVFADRAPVEEGYEHEYPVIVVANKTDLTRAGPGNPTPHEAITDEEIHKFLRELIPTPSSSGVSAEGVGEPDETAEPVSLVVDEPQPILNGNGDANAGNGHVFPTTEGGGTQDTSKESYPRTTSISIVSRSNSRRNDSRASQTRHGGTMGTTRTIYHTASSSLLDSDPSTPLRPTVAGFNWSPPASSSLVPGHGAGIPSGSRRRQTSMHTNSSTTIMPGMYRTHSHQSQGPGAALTPQTTNIGVESISSPSPAPKPRPDQGAHLLYASAKTGEGLAEIFEYTARRVVQKVEWEEEEDQRAFTLVEAEQSSRIMLNGYGTQDGRKTRGWGCCS